ncbi:carboxylating nicotinate-nucleotide diphosphorylase [Rudanella paleaurantiibacter]|uniref:Probable nicotinate-nucleotide pyrophosphorylase [carboxylating] n=1 Tax=Rudanella paleaurantiibacter TaxID=2614655 RepID=A0A7J5U1X5_9BACT|nr:carboxylating nicotinate-nucleotide diphosphorylase [Rudanella paleaurantiibacter]KAB7731777.1 carboxylating nicotinate-nucleotide diphosphorylase [Rudanella paleaurantiibacter]
MTLHEFIKTALAEDVGDGDHTSLATIPANAQRRARLLVKDTGILAGVEVALAIFDEVDPNFEVEVLMEDGVSMKPGDIVLTVSGNARNILTAERLVLNCMQRMSGIATQTRRMVNLIEGTRAQLLDTRKTTPNFRICEKMAVKIGGGVNHRFGLYDMILIKDNHIDYAGGVTQAITQANQYLKRTGRQLEIEVEMRTRAEVEEVLKLTESGEVRVDVLLLDNFKPDEIRDLVRLIDNRITTEASGGITEANLRAYAETGVNFISSGALTHHVRSLDLSLKAY